MSEVFSTEWWAVTGYTALIIVGATVLAALIAPAVMRLERANPLLAGGFMMVSTFVGAVTLVSVFAWWTG